MAALGLRGKSLLALLLTCLLAFVFAGFIGREALLGVQNRFGEAYARNVVQLNRERLFAPVSRELALAQRLAASQLTLAWLIDERNPTKRETFSRKLPVTSKPWAITPTLPRPHAATATIPTGPTRRPARRRAMK